MTKEWPALSELSSFPLLCRWWPNKEKWLVVTGNFKTDPYLYTPELGLLVKPMKASDEIPSQMILVWL